MADAERALHAFSAAQGWSAHNKASSKLRYEMLDEHGHMHLGEVEQYRHWICSRGHQKLSGSPHICNGNCSNIHALSACDQINSNGRLAATPDNEPRLAASTKTGCSVSGRVAMMKRPKPTNGTHWTADDSPCAGYRVTTNAQLLQPCYHNHYSASMLSQQPLIESVSQISSDVREEIKSLVRMLANFSSYCIRNFIMQKHELPPLLPAVWSSIVRSIRTELGIQDAGDDLKVLIERLTVERNERGAVFDMQVDSYGDLTVNTIFFMSRAMLQSFRRCGQFTVMDSTCKTNRFGLNLFLVCGVDEHQHIALFAAAFMKEETQPRFEYVLKQMKRAVGEDAWLNMACVATDGCLAMTNALFEIAPHTEQQRCVWHLQQNIIKHAGGAGHQHVIKAWWACVYARTIAEFDTRWKELLAVSGNLTSEGYPLSSLVAPVPLTSSKPGRPSSRRARAAIEGVAARAMHVMMPAAAAVVPETKVGRGSAVGVLSVTDVVQAAAAASASATVCVSASASGSAGRDGPSALVSAAAAASASVPLSISASVSALIPVLSSTSAGSVGLRTSSRGLVPRVLYD